MSAAAEEEDDDVAEVTPSSTEEDVTPAVLRKIEDDGGDSFVCRAGGPLETNAKPSANNAPPCSFGPARARTTTTTTMTNRWSTCRAREDRRRSCWQWGFSSVRWRFVRRWRQVMVGRPG